MEGCYVIGQVTCDVLRSSSCFGFSLDRITDSGLCPEIMLGLSWGVSGASLIVESDYLVEWIGCHGFKLVMSHNFYSVLVRCVGTVFVSWRLHAVICMCCVAWVLCAGCFA
ncbi:hypothetical protein V6N13_126490 [Hibiscus sabdariffa]